MNVYLVIGVKDFAVNGYGISLPDLLGCAVSEELAESVVDKWRGSMLYDDIEIMPVEVLGAKGWV